MAEHVYKLVELVGTSGTSVSDAIQNAITRASATVRNIRWFEVAQVRGEVKDGKVSHSRCCIGRLPWVASGRVRPGRVPSTVQGYPSCR